MKKAYVKPEILFEDFSLSTNIAANCQAIVGNPSYGICALEGTGEINVFSDGWTVCDYTPDDLDESIWDTICYDVPYDDNNIFNS